MAEIISMPQLSDTMKEGTLIKWNKKVGDKVSEGDILAEIETDKATQDFEIDISGVLLFIGVKEGETTRVNDVLAIIGNEGEDISHIISKLQPQKQEQKNLELESKKIQKIKKENEKIFISPVAKKMAQKIGVSIDCIKGSGEYGRIVKRDIEFYEKNHSKEKEIENRNFLIHSSMRKKIAEHLSHSKFSAPHYYLFSEINADKLIEFRKNLNNKFSSEDKISFNDIIIKAVAQSLKKHPDMNVSWDDEKIIIHPHIHIGVAVSIKDGLIVPVIKNADQKSLSQISKEIKDKALRSKLKKIQPEEIENSTFTVSNLGMYGIESFTSIINTPNTSILSIGSIMIRPIVRDHRIEIGNIMKITLSCDHRIIDGAKGSEYIQSFRNFLEDPITILV
ncbi:Dihydrolipoyllysine-residue acetyltransferase component of pyruvate dehydrogenase complex [Blattabacterium sp. (Nauphoeta cinerea)]|uniref:dihydrolipoamide acetyltransferase family protein n=1 Tax=Blattabacterium sp. (Nauphoeta cinerea) TaxID=1316444 RepID=UPI0003B0AB8A|nr:dihydrolipoamide acetyltransferase family protein [Blattabacterium sp. (Nauphoeta cinerea)]AGW85878.1 Dihydrolipoyllysine-residue acetyltransferase component of pyruvate dehydrogenase complex [Blattabacterium sp. (Nauphoeta cinerea)]